jgi:hypothetical protein
MLFDFSNVPDFKGLVLESVEYERDTSRAVVRVTVNGLKSEDIEGESDNGFS